ncbi:MAG: ABC transporter permease [Mesorhizobium sp.]
MSTLEQSDLDIDAVPRGNIVTRIFERVPEKLASIILLVIILAVWQFSVQIFQISPFVLPSPMEVWTWLVRGFTEPLSGTASFWYHLGVTAWESLVGFITGCLAGMLAGFALAHWAKTGRILYPYIQAFNALPKIAIAPLMVVWLGYGLEPKMVMSAILVFFPMLVNCMAGYHSVDPDRIDLARVCGASGRQIFFKIILPSSMPFIFAGLHMAVVLAMLGAIVGEFVGATSGLGMLLMQYNNNLQVGGVFAILIVLGAVAFGLTVLMQAAENYFCFWSRREKNFGG